MIRVPSRGITRGLDLVNFRNGQGGFRSWPAKSAQPSGSAGPDMVNSSFIKANMVKGRMATDHQGRGPQGQRGGNFLGEMFHVCGKIGHKRQECPDRGRNPKAPAAGWLT